jgi:8-oxo-dGTP pyrophosphatase MutT (NUDIX family)
MEDTVVDDGGAVDVDPDVLAAGRPHVDDVLRRAPGTFDGPVLAFRRLDDGRVVAGRSGYLTMLATSGALADPAVAARLRPLVERAAGDPVAQGRGRASVVGISVVVEVAHDGAAHLLLGRRRADLAVEPGRWGLVAGAVEPTGGPRPLRAAVERELAEEVPALLAAAGVRPSVAAGRAAVLGVAVNLVRLSPTVCVAVRLALPPGAGRAAVLSASEFTETRLVPATQEGLRVMWEALGADMTVNAAGALAAWEDAGRDRRRVQAPDRPPGAAPS